MLQESPLLPGGFDHVKSCIRRGNRHRDGRQASAGAGPCHLSVDPAGGTVLVANYGSGSIAALTIQSEGKLGESSSTIQHAGSSIDRQRKEGPHAHFITTDPANRLALACDLGLDQVLIYDLDPARASMTAHTPRFASVKGGAGPRHLVFHPGGKWVYVINEMGSSITTFAYDKKAGALSEKQTLSTLPENFSGGNSCAEIQVHPSGKFVYGSNRGHHSIAIFSVDAKTGMLTSAGHQLTGGKTPRHFGIDPSGKWLLAENQDSNNITTFRIDKESGGLSPAGQPIEVGSPVCLQFLE